MLPRVFLDALGAQQELVSLQGEDSHHFARVLRVKPGEPLVAAMTNGPWLAEVRDVVDKNVTIQLIEPYPTSEPKAHLTLVQGVAKGDKMETIFQKSTEIGAGAFIAYQADRSVAKLTGKVESKLSRWQKVCREAAMQSQRDVVPTVSYSSNLAQTCDALRAKGIEHFLFLDEDEQMTGIVSALAKVGDGTTKRALFVGPEGGWTEEERALLQSYPETSIVTLGRRILRTQTAGATAIAITLAHFGDMGG